MARASHLISATAASIAIGGVVALPAAALADAAPETGCPARAAVISYLSETYDEAPIAVGMANNGHLIEILNNPQGGTWTILVTSPDGRSCLVAAGHDLEILEAYRAFTDGAS